MYENIGIGSIIRKIGECNCIGLNRVASTLLTQQTPREDECRDLCITTGSKIVIVDFKAPDTISRYERVYENVSTRITRIMEVIGAKNSFIGFLHGFLRVDPSGGGGNGYYLSIATPLTTAFVPMSNSLLKYGSFSVGKVRIRNSGLTGCSPLFFNPFGYYYTSLINSIFADESTAINVSRTPCCLYRYFSAPWVLDLCLPCGSICEFSMEISYGGSRSFRVHPLSLAKLLWRLSTCTLGFRVSKENREVLLSAIREIAGTGDYPGSIWLFSYSHQLGLHAFPLV